jgi:hypothetical protein
MLRRTMRPRAPALLALSALYVLGAMAPPVDAARDRCIGSPNVVQLRGIVGVDSESAAIGQLRLVHGDRSIPFAVVSAQRLTGEPAEGVEVLQRLGPGTPTIRVVGTAKTLAPLLDAKSGTTVDIRGLLDDADRYLQLLEAGAEGASPSPAVDAE